MGEAVAKKASSATVDVNFAPGHDRYGPDCGAFHEAGYDAYVTGCVFAHMAKQAMSPELQPKLNSRSSMWRALYHFNLSGEDDLVTNGIIVHVRGLRGRDDKFLRGSFTDITAQSGEPLKPSDLFVNWIDDDTAFVTLPAACEDGVKSKIEKAAADEDSKALKLTSWADYQTARTSKAASETSETGEPAQK